MDKIIFFTTLVLFPFGQLLKLSNPLWGGNFNLFDASVLLLAIITILKKPKYPDWYKYFLYFILFCIFGLIINSSLLTINSILYLVRLWSYAMVAVYISNFIKQKSSVLSFLLVASIASATFGWLQYLIWPDLTSLKYLGWDDHLLRMVGTFLDPTYLGLILVLGVIIAVDKFSMQSTLRSKLITYFLLFSLAFTYSRSSYLIAVVFLIFRKKYLPLLFFFAVILLIPKNIGEGTNLSRTASGNQKITNYQETLEIIKESPIYGIGFNNLCSAKEKYLRDVNSNSHSCSGSDSSILFLLATTGVVGLILLLYAISHMPHGIILKTSFLVVLIHSLFANSLFYPHIMFWLFCLLPIKERS